MLNCFILHIFCSSLDCNVKPWDFVASRIEIFVQILQKRLCEKGDFLLGQ